MTGSEPGAGLSAGRELAEPEASAASALNTAVGLAGRSVAVGLGGPAVAVAGPAVARLAVAESAGTAVAESAGTERSEGQAVWLVLWRHGQTDWNVERRFQGQSDPPLNPAGHEQARRAARYIAALRPAAIFSSDLIRASATADALARLTGLPVQLDKDLRERNGGSWEGKTAAEIREYDPEAHAAWEPPDGEPAVAVAERAAAALERIADSLTVPSLAVVVSHGAALNMGMSRLLGLPVGLRPIGPFGNCHWSVIGRRDGRWRLFEHNIGMLPEPVPEVVLGRAAMLASEADAARDD
jgi:broad specificity phosphatase PhoE